jgi:hypothetical protein
MPIFNATSAYDRAIGIVTAALNSGSIKLHGPEKGVDNANRDAEYLNKLINSVAQNLQPSRQNQ